MSKLSRHAPLLVALALLALVATDALGCPSCKDAVADNSPGGAQGATSGGDAASGFNNAILMTLGTVFTVIGGLGWKVFSAVRRSEAA